MTPVDYYQHHRTHILTNIARSGDVIHYKNNQAQANKIVGCAFKNYILFNVIWDIYLSGITCLPFPEQACIQLVTGPLHCRNCGKAFSSPKCELSYRLLPWNPEMENFVGAPTGIEPASPAFRAGVLTTTPQHPGTKCIKFASSNHPWQMVLQHVVITTVFSHCESATYTVVQALLS